MSRKIVHVSIVFLSFLVLSCGATDEDYNNMAADICACMKNDQRPVQCVKDLESKYEDLYSYETEEDFQWKLVESMKKTEGCAEYAERYEKSLR